MSYEAWPSPDAPRGPLPRIEDLPIAEQGYDQEAVRQAFDSFYRHAAQLDASLRALESVEVFRREAGELRADLRSLRGLGFGGEPAWTTSPSYSYERAPREISGAALRVGAEAALVIAVAVIAGVAHFRAWVIVAVMAAAWAVVALSEWLAARARYRVPAETPWQLAPPEAPAAAEREGEPAPYVEAPRPEPVGWSAFEEAAAPVERDESPVEAELTMVEAQPAVEPEEPEAPEALEEPEGEAAPAAAEPPAASDAEHEDAPAAAAEPTEAEAREPAPAEPEQPAVPAQPRRRWLRRGDAPAAEAAPGPEPEPELEPVAAAAPPSHVRVLPAVDPWERGFDGDEPEPVETNETGGAGRIRRRRR